MRCRAITVFTIASVFVLGPCPADTMARQSGDEDGTFAVAALDVGAAKSSATIAVDSTTSYQTIEGLGGAICFYNGWFTAHPHKQEIFDYAFSGLNLSMLRVGNWWRGVNGKDTAIYEIAAAATERLGHSVPILMSSWSPPAYLKSNGQVANGGTLIQVRGAYDYAGFADYWHDSIQDYTTHGVVPTWIGIQNEPDWTADYDSCRFNPSEAPVNGVSYASFSLAQKAVYQRLQATMVSPPKLLGPECVGLYGNASGLRNYMTQMDAGTFYGVAHHLYGGSTDGTPDGYNPAFTTVLNTSTSLFPGKPRFMTEYGDIKGLIPCAHLIHNSLVVEQVSGYNHWSLIWPRNSDDANDTANNGNSSLIEIEFPWGSSSWTTAKGYWLNPSYWSMKHYSYFIEPGFRRVAAGSRDSDILVSAYLSPDGKRLVAVCINRSTTSPVLAALNAGSFAYDHSSVYQTAGTSHFESLGPIADSQLTLPPSSLTTIVLDQDVPVGPATDPSPIDGAIGVPTSTSLAWLPDVNATHHAVYLGTNHDAVAGATPASPEYQGTLPRSTFTPAELVSTTTYYWRVEEIAYSSSNPGSVWSFRTSSPPLRASLDFDEVSGTTASDSTGNGWTGTLINGASHSRGLHGFAVNLDGTNDYVSLPSGVVSGLTSCSITAWVSLDTVSNWSRLFDFGTGTTANMFLTPRNGSSNVVRFSITTGGAGAEQSINGTTALPAGVWTHVAVTLSGGTGVLYVNGVEAGRNNKMTLTPNALGTTTQNYIGKSQYSDPYLDGRVDDFRIYSAALSASDVAALAAQ
jgi:glucuronoarabinoxylan endo-1,4-beta-xylanase